MQPDLILVPFAQDAPAVNVDAIPVNLSPSDPPQAASWSQGFPTVTMTPLAAGGIPPRGQSFNGVLQDITEHLVYIGGGGQYRWSSAYVTAKGGYSIGDVIQSDSGLLSYVSLVDNNTDNFNTTPASIGPKWRVWAGGETPNATTTQRGAVLLATQSQVNSGSGDAVVTPETRAIASQNQAAIAFSSTGTSTAQVLTPSPVISAYTPKLRFNVTFNVASGLNPTINVSGIGVKNLKQYDSTGAKVAAVFAANQNSDIVYDGTDFVLLDILPPSPSVFVRGASTNLRASTTGLSTSVAITADEFYVKGASGAGTVLQAVNVTVNLATSGAGGLDTGTLEGSAWYFHHIIYNPVAGTVAGIASLSATAPTLPAGFTQYGRVGAVRTQVGSPFNLLSYFQVGKWSSYKPVAGTNLTSFPAVTSGSATLNTISLANFVPSTAIRAQLAAGSTNAYVGFAPAGSFSSNPGAAYLSVATPNGFPFVGGYNASSPVPTTSGFIAIDSSMSVLYASTGVQGLLQMLGWEDY